MAYQFATTCINAHGPDIENMKDNARQITYRTFVRHVPLPNVKAALEQAGLFTSKPPLREDHHVRFYKGKYQGKPCVFLDHSSIEFVWTQKEGK